jgi:hypothetical protein
MKLLLMQIHLTVYHYIPLRPKYYSQQPVLKYAQSMYVIPLLSETKFHTRTKLQGKLWFCIF